MHEYVKVAIRAATPDGPFRVLAYADNGHTLWMSTWFDQIDDAKEAAQIWVAWYAESKNSDVGCVSVLKGDWQPDIPIVPRGMDKALLN